MSDQQTTEAADAVLDELLHLRTDIGYAMVQLGPLQPNDRVRRALDALSRVQVALADLEVQ